MLKKMHISKCLGHGLLRLILLLFWSCKGLAQSSSSSTDSSLSLLTSSVTSSSKNSAPKSWTFVGAGYLAVYPTISSNQNQEYKLSFRTKHPHGSIFCHILKDYKKEEHLLLKSYKFCVELNHGVLYVTYNFNEYLDSLVIGRALNDDKWHDVHLLVIPSSGTLVVTLDGISQSQPLSAYSLSQPTTVLDWDTLPSVILYGGTDSGNSNFIGCLKNLQSKDSQVTYNDTESPIITGSVEPGCQNQCVNDNPCQNGTRCSNYYTHIKCDCFGTELQGQYCEHTGTTKATLRGYEWLTYKIYEKPENKIYSDKNRFSLQFKSERGSGVLIYAVGDECHVIASVHQGVVKVSVRFPGQVKLEVELGNNADDNRWHNLTIIHERNKVSFYYDDETVVKEVDASHYYLSFDPQIFFGGGNNFVITDALQVTQNFIGCLKNVYVNDVSLIYELKHGSPNVKLSSGSTLQYNTVSTPQFGCKNVDDIPISFPKSGTHIMLTVPSTTDFQLQFDFRTVRESALIFYAEVFSLDDYEIGFFEIWIKEHQVILHVVPSTRNPDLSVDTAIDCIVNENNWHTLHLHFNSNSTYIKIGQLSKVMNHTKLLELTEQVIIGYGRKAYDVNAGFVGCIRNLVINNKDIDPISLLQDHTSVNGVIQDGCNLVSHCDSGPHCEHGGKCLADWSGITCDCRDTAYEGYACHFPKYRTSCDNYYQSGYRQTGAYQIDLDGTGPLEPVYVWCVMDYHYNGNLYGMTKIDHNLLPDTQIRGKDMYNMRKILTYRGLDREKLVKLTQISTWCEQHIEYNCYSSPLQLGKSTIFTSASGQILELHYNTDEDSLCSCRKGTCPDDRCKCDKGYAQWEKDSGYVRHKQHLPVKEIRIIQSKSPAKNTQATGTLSLGPLNCWGDETSKMETSVTFLTKSSYLRLRPWKSTNLHFMFRTHEKMGLLLNQTQSNENSNNVLIELNRDNSIQFTVTINNNTIITRIRSQKTMHDGRWHYVAMEMDEYNIRYTLDKESQLIDMPHNQIPSFHGEIYIGGYHDEGVLSGLIGCIRGFHYNDKAQDLSKLTDPSNPAVRPGCTASCQSNPCQNGADCVEHWGTYTCTCTNQWAMWGDSCEININEDAVSFDGSNMSYLDLDGYKEEGLLDSTIILSFRTYKTAALLLYIYDVFNNFIQIELDRGDRLKLSYNHYKTVVHGSLVVNKLNDGNWKQLVIQEENHNGNSQTKMFVDSPQNSVTIPYSRLKLQKYQQNPYSDESLKPPRSNGASNTNMNEYYRVFLGGTSLNQTMTKHLTGCIRGVKIGNKEFSLQQEAQQVSAVTNMCTEGCSPNPCQHKGVCIEEWGNGQFSCDCSSTNFAGSQCQIEATGTFTGNSVLEYNFDLVRAAQHTTSENFNLTFQTDLKLGNKEMVLAVVMSAKHPEHDLLMFILTRSGVDVRHYQNRVRPPGILNKGDYTDGKPHQLQYWRQNGEIFLKIDDASMATVSSSDEPLDDLDKIMLGGLIQEQVPSYLENMETFVNFTGCISEVIFRPVKDALYEQYKPMKELRNSFNQSIHVHGDQILGCPFEDDEDPTTTHIQTKPTTTEIPKDRTMPPWNPGPAETICSGCPPPTTTMKTTTRSTSQTLQTIPTTDKTTTARLNMTYPVANLGISDTASELEIVVILAILVGLILISILIALILHKKRKRESYIIEKDLEMKVPLNHTSSPPPSQKPYDHIARLDEFSMVSATLGPSKRRKENGIIPPGSEPLLGSNENSPGDYPIQSTFYNKKKNRPASSISEVLEEMERQRREKDGVDPSVEDPEKRNSRELEWDPSTDKTPLTSVPYYDTISEEFLYKLLPLPILSVMDDIEELSIESTSTFGTLDSTQKPEDADSDVDPLQVLEQEKELPHEGNGDSGYEAESRKDGDEDVINMTPPTPEKLHIYNISEPKQQDWTLASQKLLNYNESGT